MKKILSILILLVAISVKANAQTEVLFKLKVSPDHHYVSTMKVDMDVAMTVSGTVTPPPAKKGAKPATKTSKANAAKIKAVSEGIKSPIQMTMGYAVIGDTKTGAATGDKIPFTMVIKMQTGHMKMNGKDMPTSSTPPAIDQTLYGKF